MSDELISIDEEAMALSIERKLMCVARACRTIGVAYEWDPDGVLLIDHDDIDGIDDLMESEEFIEAYTEELKKMVVNDLLTTMAQDDLIKPIGTDDEGEVRYGITAKGEARLHESRMDD